MRHPVRTELRSGLVPWTALATTVTVLVPMAAKSSSWQGGWEECQQLLHVTAVLLGGPLAAASGCCQGGRERRTATDELRASAARSPLAQFAVSALPVAFAVLVGYACAAGAVSFANQPYTATGSPPIAPLVADGVFLAGAAVAGAIVGRLVRWRLAAPALAACAYVALGLPTYADTPVRYLNPAVEPGGFGVLAVWWQPWARIVWTGGLVLAGALAYAARRHRHVALVPLLLAVAAAVPLVRPGEDVWRRDPLAAAQVCDTSAPRICVSARNANLLPDLSRALSGITRRLVGVRNVPARFVDTPDTPRREEVELPQLFLGQSVVRGRLAEPEAYAWDAASSLVSRDCSAPSESATDEAVRDWLVDNALSRQRRKTDTKLFGNVGVPRALDRLASMDEEKRRDWLGRYFAASGTCTKGPTL